MTDWRDYPLEEHVRIERTRAEAHSQQSGGSPELVDDADYAKSALIGQQLAFARQLRETAERLNTELADAVRVFGSDFLPVLREQQTIVSTEIAEAIVAVETFLATLDGSETHLERHEIKRPTRSDG